MDLYDLSGITWTGKQVLAVSHNGAIYTSPDGIAWEKSVTWVAHNLNSVTWTGEQYVAVGDSGTIFTSPDGLKWIRRPSGTVNHLADVIWTGTRLVAMGTYGTILISTDGVTWSPALSGFTYRLVSIAWSGSLFAAIGDSGIILTSNDGIEWTLRKSGSSESIRKIVWAGNRFVAMGNYGTTFTSIDGIEWATTTPPVIRSMNCMVWTGRRLVAAGEKGIVQVSSDGVEWTQQSYGSKKRIDNLAWTGKRLVVFEGIDTVRFSDDEGITWTAKPVKNPTWIHQITWSGTQFVGISEPKGGSAFVSSLDGIEWTTIAQWNHVLNIRSMIPNGDEVIATGLEGVFAVSLGKKSLERLDSTASLEFGAVIRGGNQYVGVGGFGLIMTSPAVRPMGTQSFPGAAKRLGIYADVYRLHITLPASMWGQSVRVEINSIDGRRVREATVNHADKVIHFPLENLRSGYYTVHVESAQTTHENFGVWFY
jgi:hypothetical protein